MIKEQTSKNLQRAALGFRVKSGRAIAVLVVGPTKSPQVLDHRVIQLSDPAQPETIQPYHARMGKLEENSVNIRRRTGIIQRVAQKSVAQMLKEFRTKGYKIQTAGLVVGSLIDPAAIGNPHVRAHALEGRLFRTILEKALRRQKVPSLIMLERDVYPLASAALGRSEAELKSLLTDFGRSLDGPWRADEKVATLAGWMTFAKRNAKA